MAPEFVQRSDGLLAAVRDRLQEHVPLPQFLRSRLVRRIERHHRTAFAAVGRPVRQVGAVGISGRDEIDPVARRQLRPFAIRLLMQPWECVEIVEHIKKLARMEGAGIATVTLAEPPFRRQWRTVETKAENVSAAALLLRLAPGPGGMDDDEIA